MVEEGAVLLEPVFSAAMEGREHRDQQIELEDTLHEQLLDALREVPLELERMSGVGAWILRGPAPLLALLEGAESPLQGLPVRVIRDEETYVTLSS